MKIGGFVDLSLVDVPKIPVSVVFMAGCNFNCAYCHASNLIPLESGIEMSIDEIIFDVSKTLSSGVCISGGEPTIQSDIVLLVSKLKEQNKYVNLNTNGSNPEVLSQLIDVGLDSIWLDIKAPINNYNRVVRTSIKNIWQIIQESVKLIQESNTELWIRTTLVNPLVKISDLPLIGNWLKSMKYKGNWTIQNYIFSAGVKEEYESKLYRLPEEEFNKIVGDLSYLKNNGINVII